MQFYMCRFLAHTKIIKPFDLSVVLGCSLILGTLIFGNASRLPCRCTFVSSANSISYSVPDDNLLQ